MKGRVYSKCDRRTCERSVHPGRRGREGEKGEKKARAEGRGVCRQERPGEESLSAGRERGRRRAGGAVELKGRSGAEIGRGRVPRSGHKKSEAGFTRARGHARRQDGRLRYPSCGTEVWVWRGRPWRRQKLDSAEAPWCQNARACEVLVRLLPHRGGPWRSCV